MIHTNTQDLQGQGSQRLQSYEVITDLNALGRLKAKANQDPSAALKPAAQQFEALFVQQILKEARKVQLDDGYMDGGQSDFYKSWHDDQLAQSISAKGSLGIADQIVKQLTPKVKPLTPEAFEIYQKKLAQKQQAAMQPAATTEQNLALRALK